MLQKRRAGDVVGMDVRFQRASEAKAKLLDQRAVAAHLLEHRVDQDRLARGGSARR